MKTVLITGASSGIGFEFARFFGEKGCDLFLCSHNEKRMRETVQKLKKNCIGQIHGFSINLAQKGSADKLYELINKNYNKKVDILINNAGIGFFGDITQMTMCQVDKILTLNVYTLVNLTQLFITKMNSGGAIINVASVVGFFPIPYSTLYAASKAFVLNYSEGLAEELKSKNIQVLALCPGTTKTNFFERAIGQGKVEREKGIFKFNRAMNPDKVVTQAIIALEKGKIVEINGFINKFVVFFASKFMSRNMVRKLATKIGLMSFKK